MQLTSIEYNVIMEAINQAYDAIDNDTFMDPYAENPDGYTNESLRKALESVERKIISDNVPY